MAAKRELFFNPGTYFPRLIRDLDQAEQEIILEVYIFRLDDIGRKVLAALEGALTRGVDIRLLLDGVGSYFDAREIADRLETGNAIVRIFHPLPWDFSIYRNALYAGRWYSQVLYFLASINRRNHRKLCIIDRNIAWLGSYNITASHANSPVLDDDDYWHDTGLRLSGRMVRGLRANFEMTWRRKGAAFNLRARHFLARNAASRRKLERMQLLQMLHGATRRIWITNAYFNPSRQILRLLKAKARQGLSVQLIVPSRSDVLFFPALSRSFYTDLLLAEIRVFEYQHRILHSKTMLVDDQVLIGSTNLNYRSLFHDLELDALLEAREIVQPMEQRFIDDIGNSREITLRNWQEHPLALRLASWVARFLRYWL